MNQVLEVLNYFATHFPWEVLVAAGILSPVLAWIKKFFSVQSEKVMISLVGLVSVSVAAVNYLIHVPTQDPGIIAVQGSVLAFTTQPIYFLFVKPAIAWLSETLRAAAAFKEQVQAAAVPAGAKVDDFSS